MTCLFDNIRLQKIENNVMLEIMDYLMLDDSSTKFLVQQFDRLSSVEKLQFFQQSGLRELEETHCIDVMEFYNSYLV